MAPNELQSDPYRAISDPERLSNYTFQKHPCARKVYNFCVRRIAVDTNCTVRPFWPIAYCLSNAGFSETDAGVILCSTKSPHSSTRASGSTEHISWGTSAVVSTISQPGIRSAAVSDSYYAP